MSSAEQMKIRDFEPADEDAVIGLALELRDYARTTPHIDTDKLRERSRAIEKSDDWFYQVVESENKILGFLVGCVSDNMMFTSNIGLMEFWYIQPEARSYRLSSRMMRNFINWCRQKDAEMIHAGHVYANPLLDSLFERLEFKRIGSGFVMDL